MNEHIRLFSQFGEDKWIIDNIPLPKVGVFVEVGVGFGTLDSNTYLLEQNGWSGVCIEGDPFNYKEMVRNRRCRCELAVLADGSEVDFNLCSSFSYISGIKKPIMGEYTTIKVKSKTLNEVLRKNEVGKIDLLSIDTEGNELQILEYFDIQFYKPTIVIIEFLTQDVENKDIKPYFDKLGMYNLVHTTFSNYIYLLKEEYAK